MPRNSKKRIFEMDPDYKRFPDQWFLTEPQTSDGQAIDAREFTNGRPYHGPLPAVVPIRKLGKQVAFHLGAFDMPIVSQAVAKKLVKIAPDDIECFPVEVPGAKSKFVILNVKHALDCVDEEKSEITRWKKSDGRPDRLGQYHMISTIVIDPARTDDHHLFRIKTWPIALLVSDVVKRALENVPKLGVVFKPAS